MTDARAVEDRLDVIETCTKMHWLVDRKQWDRLHEVLASEVCFPTLEEQESDGFDPASCVRSLESIMASYEITLGGLFTQHLIAGHQVELDGDTAVCQAHSINVHYPLPPAEGSRVTHGNEYLFELARTPAGWRITGRRTRILWSEGDEQAHDVGAKQRQWLASMAADGSGPTA
ncbi:MAG: hypothetical protein JWN67_3249 [Actinomycetia bacterium]|nr:hypothetical protein [Actinomycetes bacterium]